MKEGAIQKFAVTITWSPESDLRLTEGDIQEVIEQMVSELDEDGTVDVAEGIEQ